jgi:hypothetical protein
MRVFTLILFLCATGVVFSQDPIKHDSLRVPARRRVEQSTKSEPTGSTKRTRSRIVNDSAKIVYGPKTTLSTVEQDIFENNNKYEQLDTSILNLHRWDFVRKYENKYQDLGNVGTALNPIFPQVQSTIGANPGFKVYDLYYESAEPRYYNTKSPFARINVVWGGKGRSLTHIEFTRNINPRWNFGFNYRPILTVKQIQATGKADYQVRSQYYDFYTTYESKNRKYKLLFSYRRIKHHAIENGGVQQKRDSTYFGYFDPNAVPHLTASSTNPSGSFASTDELRSAVHFFHQFQLANAAQFYHTLDLFEQVNTFHVTPNPETISFFGLQTNLADTTFVNDVNTFKVTQNEIGFKGNAAFLFYDFYYKLRSYSNNMANLQGQVPGSTGLEGYVGSRIAFRFASTSTLAGQAEYLLDGHYKIDGALRTPWLDAELKSYLAKPGFMQQGYYGGYNTWVNNFNSTFTNQLSGRIKAQLGPLFISPGLTYTTLHNYIYFVHLSETPQIALPQQSSDNQQIFSPEVRMDIRLIKGMHLRPYIINTTLLGNLDHAISMPTWFTNVQLSYENFLFKGALQMQVGIDAHSTSAYKALGYDPAIQQFYIQDNIISPSFWTTDIFLNGRIKRGRFFVKYINLLQAFTKQGYMPTPGYPNVRNTLDFGFELILFD